MLIFKDAKDHFLKAYQEFGNRDESRFYHDFAQMIPNDVDVETLVLAFKIAFRDIYDETLTPIITIVPSYVRQGCSTEFFKAFRKLYAKEVMGLMQEDLPEGNFEVNTVGDDIIDISQKDLGAVFAALYNAVYPVGMGLVEYDFSFRQPEEGKILYDFFGKKSSDGSVSFKYVCGRLMPLTFKDNLVYVENYNATNAPGLAQEAIATCPNITIEEELTLNKQKDC